MASSSRTSPNEPKQLWFFVRENMSDAQFEQVTFTLEEIRTKNLSLQFCLDVTKTSGAIDDYAFYIHSNSMAAAVRLLSDKAIIATCNLYCQADPIVTITVRGKNDPSPNSSQAPSHKSSLEERRKTSKTRGLLLPELSIQPKVSHVTGGADAVTLEPILHEDTMVSIRVGDAFETFTMDYLLGTYSAHSP